jgi:hypothetical protein
MEVSAQLHAPATLPPGKELFSVRVNSEQFLNNILEPFFQDSTEKKNS